MNPLDVWLNVHYDDRLQFKLGRMFTPFTYELFNQPTNAMIVPERSLFYNNFGPGRDSGAMAWGHAYDNRVDYAVGIFNGFRNGFIDTNDFKDVVATINFRPFLLREDSWLEHLNFGGSVAAEAGQLPSSPQVMRTNVAFSGNLTSAPSSSHSTATSASSATARSGICTWPTTTGIFRSSASGRAASRTTASRRRNP